MGITSNPDADTDTLNLMCKLQAQISTAEHFVTGFDTRFFIAALAPVYTYHRSRVASQKSVSERALLKRELISYLERLVRKLLRTLFNGISVCHFIA